MTSSIARMNCFLHGIEDFRIERGDTLAEPKLVEGDHLQRFDVVLANPPYSIKQWNREAFAADPWGRNVYGVPPQGRADYAFQQHILQSLKPKTGRCAVLWPHGVLFRKEEADMRRKLIEADLIECVIGLGPNLFYNSAMDSCVVICRTNKGKNRRGKILLIDAKDEVTRERTQSFLSPEHIACIIQTYLGFKEEPLFSRVVSLAEVRANDGNLNIALYIDSTPKNGGTDSTNHRDLEVAFRNYSESAAGVHETLAKMLPRVEHKTLKGEVALHKICLPKWIDKSKWKRVRLGDVAVRDAGKIEPDGTIVYRWVAADHIDEGDIHVHRWSDTNDPLFPPTFRFTFKAGNVLLHSRNPKKVVIPRFDGITGEKLFVLKARDSEALREDFLAFILMSSGFSDWVSKWMSGSVNKFLNWSAFEKFEFGLPPLDQQRRIAEILWAVDEVTCSHLKSLTVIGELLDSFKANLGSDQLFGNGLRLIEDFQAGDGWQMLTGKDLVSAPITRGYTPTGAINTDCADIPFIKVYNLCFDGGFNFTKEPTFIEPSAHHGTLLRSQTLPGDILINLTGPPMGKVSVVPDTYPTWNINQAIARYRISDALLRDYFVIYLQSQWAQKWFDMRAKKTSGQKNITLQLAQDIPVPIPPRREMEQFVDSYHKVAEAKSFVSSQMVTDNILTKSILNCIC